MFVAPAETLFSENEVVSKIKIVPDNRFIKNIFFVVVDECKDGRHFPCGISTEKHSAPRWDQKRKISLKQKYFILYFHLPLEKKKIFSYILNKSSIFYMLEFL